MNRITAKVDGMVCSMCASHINDAIRRAFPVKKVSTSLRKKETVILTEADIEEEELRSVINEIGYRILSFHSEPCTKGS